MPRLLCLVAFDRGIGVADQRAVARARPSVQLLKQDIVDRRTLALRNGALRIVSIAEDDRLRGAALLARGNHIAVMQLTIVPTGSDLSRSNPLDAIGALFHDAAATNGDLRVPRLGGAIHLVSVGVEIEATDLVRAIVGAKSRPDTAVVDHKVETLMIMDSGMYGTNHFARRVLAMHARHRFERSIRRIGGARIVSIDPQPMHHALFEDLILADHGHIVLCLAGDHAGLASDA